MNAPQIGLRDGFNTIRWNNTFVAREKKVAKYIRTGLNITIRLKLLPYKGMAASVMISIQTAVQGALDYWNSAGPISNGSPDTLKFRVELVSDYEDATVQIRKRPTQGKKEPNNSKEWWQDAQRNNVAHELGHLMGLMDEYYVYDRKADRNKGVSTKAQRRAAEKKDYLGREKLRAKNGPCGTSRPANLMEFNRDPQHIMIDRSLIRSIFDAQNIQRPCIR